MQTFHLSWFGDPQLELFGVTFLIPIFIMIVIKKIQLKHIIYNILLWQSCCIFTTKTFHLGLKLFPVTTTLDNSEEHYDKILK